MELTHLLERLGSPEADTDAENEAWNVIYPEMLRLARVQRRRWKGNWTMETRVLAHEAYLKLFGSELRDYENSRHFLRLVSRAIRQILVNYAEARSAAKRGGPAEDLPLDAEAARGVSTGSAAEILELDMALERLRELDPRAADVVELRFFAGLTQEEIAEALEISLATVGRDWAAARAWLSRELGPDPA